jgi:hypothetical protein
LKNNNNYESGNKNILCRTTGALHRRNRKFVYASGSSE